MKKLKEVFFYMLNFCFLCLRCCGSKRFSETTPFALVVAVVGCLLWHIAV